MTLQERTLHNDKSLTFYQLVQKEKSVTIHTRNFQFSATEIFKVKISISPIIMTEIFKLCDSATCDLRSGQVLERRHNRTTEFETYYDNQRHSDSFKQGTKNWNPSYYPCRLFKIYVQNVGFI